MLSSTNYRYERNHCRTEPFMPLPAGDVIARGHGRVIDPLIAIISQDELSLTQALTDVVRLKTLLADA